MSFKTPLQMEHIHGTEKYKLLSDLVYVTWEGVRYFIYEGFSCDGHSIPKLLRSFCGCPFATKWPRAAFYHDWLLATLVAQGLMTQFEAASEYSRAMKDDGASTFVRKRNWLGVRCGDIWHNLKRKWRGK